MKSLGNVGGIPLRVWCFVNNLRVRLGHQHLYVYFLFFFFPTNQEGIFESLEKFSKEILRSEKLVPIGLWKCGSYDPIGGSYYQHMSWAGLVHEGDNEGRSSPDPCHSETCGLPRQRRRALRFPGALGWCYFPMCVGVCWGLGWLLGSSSWNSEWMGQALRGEAPAERVKGTSHWVSAHQHTDVFGHILVIHSFNTHS